MLLISKGKLKVLFPKILISSILISTKPVSNLWLIVSSSRFFTVPQTLTADSTGICDAKSTSSSLPDVTICVIPYISLMSKKTKPPKSLIVSTQPKISTFSPSFSKRSSLHFTFLYSDIYKPP